MLGEFIRTHKFISTFIAVAVVGLLVFLTAVYISRIGKESIPVYLVPSDATLLVNGEKIGTGTHFLKPGTYNVQASREGFASYEGTVTVGSPNTATIDIALVPESESAKAWQRDNISLYQQYEGRASARATSEGATFREENPIVTQLPYDDMVFSIGYTADPDNPSGIILQIDTITGYRNAAVNSIRELGFDPNQYKINFNNYKNPFSHE